MTAVAVRPVIGSPEWSLRRRELEREGSRCVDCGHHAKYPKIRCDRCAAKQRKIAADQRQYYARNKEKIAADKRQYRARNKEKIAADQRQYYARNKEKIAADKRQYYARNKEKIAADKRQYYARNKEKIAADQRQYRARNKEKIAADQRQYRARAGRERWVLNPPPCANCGNAIRYSGRGRPSLKCDRCK